MKAANYVSPGITRLNNHEPSPRKRAMTLPATEAIAVPGELSATGLELEPGLALDAWVEIGRRLGRIRGAYRWWVGDWLNYGEHTYGEGYTQEMDATGLDYDGLITCARVAERIEFTRRRVNLSWSHHEEVAALEPAEQDTWLDKAEANQWTVKELRSFLKGSKPKPLPTHTPLLTYAAATIVPLPTPVIVAQILRVCFPDAHTALDTTGGDGGFWDGSEPVQVTRLVVDPGKTPGEDGAADFRYLDDADNTYDVALIDPPHLADGGRDSIMVEKFGTYSDADLADVIRDGCREAWRVARLGVIAKVTDHVHGQQYVRETVWVEDAIGQAPYAEVVQLRATAVIDPKWEEQLSPYNNGSTYLVFRKDGPLHKRRSV